MVDRPMIFSAPMVRALLEGRKTQTRRLMPGQAWLAQAYDPIVSGRRIYNYAGDELVSEARFAPGDRLWVREAWRATGEWDCHPPRAIQPGYTRYEADPCVAHSYGKLRPSIFMPRWASRLTLMVTDVKVERLQDISEADAVAEGIERSEKFADRFGRSTLGSVARCIRRSASCWTAAATAA